MRITKLSSPSHFPRDGNWDSPKEGGLPPRPGRLHASFWIQAGREHRSSEGRPPVRTDLAPGPPMRRLAPLGQLREALARHNARLNANSSDICCSRSTKASRRREIDLAQNDM